MPEKIKKLIINADDFGLHKSINEAVEQAHRRGIVTSASLAANGDAFGDALEIARRNTALGVGLHFNLTGGFPVSSPDKVKTLIDANGRFYEDHWKLPLKMLKGELNVKEIALEARSQLDKLYDNGLVPTHIDSHRHLHFFPFVFQAIEAVLKEYKIVKMRYLNIPCFELARGRGFRLAAALYLKTFSMLNRKKFKHPDFFYGFFDPGRLDKERLLYLLKKIRPAVTEINFHPGINNEEIGKKYGFWNKYFPWKFDWHKEYALLIDDEIKAAVGVNNLRLSNYSSL